MYAPPLKDMRFVLRHLVKIDDLNMIMPHEALNADLADAVLGEAGRLAADVIAPTNHRGDQIGAVWNKNGSVTTPDGFIDAYQAMAKAGWTAMDAHADYGGQNMPMVISAFVNEMWQSANMSFALCHLLTQGLIYALQKTASPEQKRLFIPPMVEGRWTGTMNLTEPHAGSDLAAIKTSAVPCDNHYLITGQKIYITYGEHDLAENIIHLVLARTPKAPPGIKGISVFIVPKYHVNPDGSKGERNDVRCISIEKKLGIKASPTATLHYGEEGGAVGYLVGEENKGIEIMFEMMNHARFNVGVQGLAICERAYQQAAAYAAERRQGTPLGGCEGDAIIHHPDVMRLLATTKAEIEAMRALVGLGAMALDLAEADHEQQEQWRTRASLIIPVIKGWLTERAQILTSAALQVHGGAGFIEDTGAAQHYRDARILSIYEGTTAIQANDLVFRKTFRDQGGAVTKLLDEINDNMTRLKKHADKRLSSLASEVLDANGQCQNIMHYLIASAHDARKSAVSASAYLMALGTLMGGWQMARGAQAAISERQSDPKFAEAKIVSAEIFIRHNLPWVSALAVMITKGDEAILAMRPEWLPGQ